MLLTLLQTFFLTETSWRKRKQKKTELGSCGILKRAWHSSLKQATRLAERSSKIYWFWQLERQDPYREALQRKLADVQPLGSALELGSCQAYNGTRTHAQPQHH